MKRSTTRKSFELRPEEWAGLSTIAAETASVSPRSKRPSWRYLMRRIALGELAVGPKAGPAGNMVLPSGTYTVVADGRPATLQLLSTHTFTRSMPVELQDVPVRIRTGLGEAA